MNQGKGRVIISRRGEGRGGHYFAGEGHDFFPLVLGRVTIFFNIFLGEGHNFFKVFLLRK